MYPKTRTILKNGIKDSKNSKTWIANKGMNGVIGMRAPVTTDQIAIKDAERQKKGRPIKEKEMVSKIKGIDWL